MVEYITVKVKRGVLCGGHAWKRPQTVTVFCACRFHSQESEQFRETLERKLSETERLRDVTVADGKQVPLGRNGAGRSETLLSERKW